MKGRITFRDVSFAYPTRDDTILKNVNFDIPTRKFVAVVGSLFETFKKERQPTF